MPSQDEVVAAEHLQQEPPIVGGGGGHLAQLFPTGKELLEVSAEEAEGVGAQVRQPQAVRQGQHIQGIVRL